MGMKTRFDLEQEIMECWNITSDIDDVYNYVMEGSEELGTVERDKVANLLLGLSALYELKFNKLFSTFTDCLERGEFKKVELGDE